MKTIGVIGAGISGLAAAKAFHEHGYKVTVLEKSSAIGGVWDKNRFYINVSTQTTKNEYAYSDLPMPAYYHEWPTGNQMNEYLNSYAKHFGIDTLIQCNTTITEMEYVNSRWHLSAIHTQQNTSHTYIFDFVVICTGTFSQQYIPRFPGMKEYKAAGGQILHSSEVKHKEILENKHVAVVGFAKSATDIATQAADLSSSCTLLFRKTQWKVPRFFAGSVNLKYLLFSRFSEAFFLPYRKSGFQKFLHSIGKPLVWMQWRMIEQLLKAQFRLKKCGLLPMHRIEDQISCSLGVAPEGFYKKVRTGKINAIQSEIDHFTSNGIMLKNGETVKPDIVVMGTGFKQSLPFLKASYLDLIRNPDGQFNLYRNIINLRLPGVGFVGFNSSLFSTLTSEVAANWLVEYVSGHVQLPSEAVIKKELDIIAQWKLQKRPIATEFSGLCVAPFNFQHLDQLMTDMGLRVTASKNWVYEFFKPINPKDYNKLLQQLRGMRHPIKPELLNAFHSQEEVMHKVAIAGSN
ncbi:MAG TPA: NAD(P)-binding domain-containing protein [Niabella sp.]|nr:NAD(P)-binding domain-containing protein [Niabella sp.]